MLHVLKHGKATIVDISAPGVKHGEATIVDISALWFKTLRGYYSGHQCSMV